MEDLLENFNDKNWKEYSIEIEQILKKELHFGGLVEHYRQTFEEERQQKLTRLKLKFKEKFDIENVDNQLNEYTKNISKINQNIQNQINFDLFNFAKNNLQLLSEEYPNTHVFINKVAFGDLNKIYISRLLSIFVKVTVDSTNQSNKSNAGNAGEDMVDTMITALGIKEGVGYKKQHKSVGGSNTDFIFPYVEDGTNLGVEIYVAVQFSSNDRIRMVSSESKSGAQKYAVTGNGMDACSKTLDDIGMEHLESMRQDHMLVCFEKELKRKIDLLQIEIEKVNKNGSIPKSRAKNQTKLDYFQKATISFSEFAKRLKKRFSD